MKQAIVIRHIAFEDLGNLAEVLNQHNFTINYFEAGQDNLHDIEPLKPDLLIILGGPIGAYDEQDFPFLMDEISLLQRRLAADLPTLGICLGAQLMARALGAKVYSGPEKEIGWSAIELTDAGERSPLSYLASEHTFVLHWHGDTFDLPTGAIHLAKSSKYINQAFVWGKNGLALQFHPEVTARGLERWFIGHAAEIHSTPHINTWLLRNDTIRYAQNLEKQSVKFWQAWLKTLETNKPVHKQLSMI